MGFWEVLAGIVGLVGVSIALAGWWRQRTVTDICDPRLRLVQGHELEQIDILSTIEILAPGPWRLTGCDAMIRPVSIWPRKRRPLEKRYIPPLPVFEGTGQVTFTLTYRITIPETERVAVKIKLRVKPSGRKRRRAKIEIHPRVVSVNPEALQSE